MQPLNGDAVRPMEVPRRGVPTRPDGSHHGLGVGRKPLVAHSVIHGHKLRLWSRVRNAPLPLGQTGEGEGGVGAEEV
eukprot:7637020-Alexandrium_andersonii.AAC.1